VPGVVVGEIFDLGHRRRLIELVVGRFRDGFGHEFRHLLDVDRGAGLARAFGDGVGHFLDVTVRGIIEDENFCHGWSPGGWFEY
jgi:hypothetical protein